MADLIQEMENRDPITNEKGAHPVGAGLGAFAGGTTGIAGSMAAGAAFGAGGGPVGMLAGVTIGALVGGLLGKSFAEMVMPTEEDTYWRRQYRQEPYYQPDRTYEDYEPAYRLGRHARLNSDRRSFEEVEAELEREYNANRRAAALDWSANRAAAYAAWLRADRQSREGSELTADTIDTSRV